MRAFMKRHYLRAITFLLSLVFTLCGIWIVTSLAQSSVQEKEEERPPWKIKKVRPKDPRTVKPETGRLSERVIEDQIPSHLPIKVEVLNYEKDPLLRHIEVKVTNTGEKSIYYLGLHIDLPDVLSPNGNPMFFPLRYGRLALIESDTPIEDSDVPFKPGESIILKPEENNIKGFEGLASKGKLSRPDFDKISLTFEELIYEDRTGYWSFLGLPKPSVRKISSVNKGANEAQSSSDLSCPNPQAPHSSYNMLAALISPILFLTAHSSKGKSPPSPDTCCSGATGCYFGKAGTYGCVCGNGRWVL
jgi:hypothetical protein